MTMPNLHLGLRIGLRVKSSLIGLLVAVRTGYPHGEVPIMYIHVIYVDDMIITGDDSEYIAFVKAHLHE